MSHLIHSANRRTHLKIVVLGLLGAILVTVRRLIRASQRHRSRYCAVGQGQPLYNRERALTGHSITAVIA